MSCQWRSTEGYNTGPSIALVRHQNLARNCCEIDWVFASTNCVGVSQFVVVMHTVVTVCWMLGSTDVAWVAVFFTIGLINCLQTACVCGNPSQNIPGYVLLATSLTFAKHFRPQPFNNLKQLRTSAHSWNSGSLSSYAPQLQNMSTGIWYLF